MSDAGFQQKLTLRISENEKDIIVFSLEQPSLVKVFTRSHSSRNAVTVKLMSSTNHTTVLAS